MRCKDPKVSILDPFINYIHNDKSGKAWSNENKSVANRADDGSNVSFCFSRFYALSSNLFFFVREMPNISLQHSYDIDIMSASRWRDWLRNSVSELSGYAVKVTLKIMCGNRWKESLAAVLRKQFIFKLRSSTQVKVYALLKASKPTLIQKFKNTYRMFFKYNTVHHMRYKKGNKKTIQSTGSDIGPQ